MGNKMSAHTPNIRTDRSVNGDYYATEPKAVELLLQNEKFDHPILEPACGEGHISEVLKRAGYIVKSFDLYDRSYGETGVNFLEYGSDSALEMDIIANPPYSHAKRFVTHALDIVKDGCKVAMFLKLTFLESQSRRDLFRNRPPKTVYVSSARLQCGKNGVFSKDNSAVAYCWMVWVKGWTGNTELKWIN